MCGRGREEQGAIAMEVKIDRKLLRTLVLSFCVLGWIPQSSEGERNLSYRADPVISAAATANTAEAGTTLYWRGAICITGVIIAVLLAICTILYHEYLQQLRQIRILRKTLVRQTEFRQAVEP